MFCKFCGSKLIKDAKFCTNCGNIVEKDETKEVAKETTTNNINNTGSDTASLVLGIISLVLFFIPVIGFILGIISLILGLSYKKKSGKSVGFALGLAGTILNIVFLAFIILVAIVAIFDTPDDEYYEDSRYNYHEHHDGYM